MRIPAHSVCTAIRDDIVSGVFERGSRLTEEVLARRYGVSRVPVREALRTLESEGFVVTRRRRRPPVSPSPPGRRPPTSWRSACSWNPSAPHARPSAAPTRTSRCSAAWSSWARSACAGGGEDLRALGGWFHETLAQASGSPALIALLTQLRHKIAWMYAVEQPLTPGDSWAEHGALVDAVARRDAERARALAVQHTERATAAHRLRRTPGQSTGGRTAGAAGVRTSQHPVNIAGARH